ncbi:MAG: hypothetical protein K8L91_31865 [Anaerolineae bacterium]|nr:MAG: hypothetical protein F9K46_05045 [Anaerolineae bacterium]MBZ0321056.1 hypothetical protein [Anaerolineae bacterium]
MNPNGQFSFTGTGCRYKAVVSLLAPGEWHWQVIRLSNSKVEIQGETKGNYAQVDALSIALDALREIKEQEK